MKFNGSGFIFDGKMDINGKFGVKESFKSNQIIGNKLFVELEMATDNKGVPLAPACLRADYGYLPLSNILETDDDLERFIKSNKPTYGVWGTFCYICCAKLMYDMETGSLIDSESSATFYIPKDINGGNETLICQRISCKDGMNMFTINENLLKGLENNMESAFSMDNCMTRLSVTAKRLQTGGETV